MTDAPETAAPKRARKGLPLWGVIGAGVGGLVALVLIGLVLLLAFFPKDAAIAEIERQVEMATGRDLTVAGDVSFTIWPAVGFTAEQVSLSNPEGFPDTPFVSVDRVVFAAALMPLLRGDLEVRRLYLEKPALALVAKADGHGNWEFPVSEAQGELPPLRLEDLRIIDGRFSFAGAEGEPLVLEKVNANFAVYSLDRPLDITGTFDYRNETFQADATITAPRAVLEQKTTPLKVDLTSDVVNVRFDGTADAMTGALDGAIEAQGSSARALFAWQGSPMDAGPGFGAWTARGQMHRQDDTLRLREAAFTLDAIRAAGGVTVVTTPAGRMTISGGLSMPSLDLNTYLPPPPQAEAGVEVSAAWPNDPIDLTGLNAADANLDLAIGALKFQKLEFTNARLALGIRNGIADARLSRVAMYGGSGTGRLVADGRTRTNRIAVDLDAQNVDALPFLNAAIGLDKLEGRGRLRATLAGEGVSQLAIMRTLRGTASFNFADGRWKGVNLGQMAQVLQRLQGQQQTAQGAATEFSSMSATFALTGGVATTQDMQIVTPVAPIAGTGFLNIGGQTLDLRLVARQIPMRVRGPWARPQFGLDSEAAGALLRDQVAQQAQRALGRTDLGDLGALFGFGSTATPAATSPAEAPAAASDAPAAATPAVPAPEAEKEKSLEDRAREQARDAIGGLFNRN